MSQVMKSFMGIFLIMFLAMVSMGVLSAFMGVIDARDLHAQIIDELENSDYSANVMREQFDIAERAGYQLDITIYRGEDQVEYTGKDQVADLPSGAELAKVCLTFPFRVGFFGFNDAHTLCGYAR